MYSTLRTTDLEIVFGCFLFPYLHTFSHLTSSPSAHTLSPPLPFPHPFHSPSPGSVHPSADIQIYDIQSLLNSRPFQCYFSSQIHFYSSFCSILKQLLKFLFSFCSRKLKKFFIFNSKLILVTQ